MRIGEQGVERRAIGIGPEALAERAAAEHQIEHPLRTATPVLGDDRDDLVGIAAVHHRRRIAGEAARQATDQLVVDDRHIGVEPLPLGDQRQLGDHLPLVGLARVEREHGAGVVGDVADGELEQQHVVVRTLQR